MNRRRAMAALALLGAGAAYGQCEPADDVPWRNLADGLWVWTGAQADIDAHNGGHVAPTVALVRGKRSLLVDPGPSARHAARVRRSLRCLFGAEVSDIVNTHAHAENVMGNAAFADEIAAGHVRVWATAATRAAMQQRCPACLESLTRRVGAEAMAGTTIVWPTHTLAEGDVLALGDARLRVQQVEQGHTEGDLVLWWSGPRVLLAGGLVVDGRLPELAQGSLDGWLAALGRLAALRPRWVVGGGVTTADGIAATERYLSTLRREVLAAMDAGRLAGERDLVPMPAWRHWAGHAERQGFNVQRAWRELEPVWMQPASPQQIGR